MILTDTGPLVALFFRRDANHLVAVRALPALANEDLVTTWPCLTEAMYLLGDRVGYAGQAALWAMFNDGSLTLRDPGPGEAARMAALMRTYQNLPMDLADASLVSAAEATGERQVFTFDKHFRVYVLADGSSLNVMP